MYFGICWLVSFQLITSGIRAVIIITSILINYLLGVRETI